MKAVTRMQKHVGNLVVATLLAGGGIWFKVAFDRVQIPIKERLAIFTTNSVQARFRMPPARTFALVLGIPKEAANLRQFDALPWNNFSGKAQVFEGTNLVVEFGISSTNVQSCNWLQGQGLTNAWILTWNGNGSILRQALKPDSLYEVNIKFDESPPRESSLWMAFVVLHKDHDRAKNLVLAQ